MQFSVDKKINICENFDRNFIKNIYDLALTSEENKKVIFFFLEYYTYVQYLPNYSNLTSLITFEEVLFEAPQS